MEWSCHLELVVMFSTIRFYSYPVWFLVFRLSIFLFQLPTPLEVRLKVAFPVLKDLENLERYMAVTETKEGRWFCVVRGSLAFTVRVLFRSLS
jgi:hypothetical protein